MFRFIFIILTLLTYKPLSSQTQIINECGNYYLNLAERFFLIEEYQLSSIYYLKSLDSGIRLQEENHINAMKSLTYSNQLDMLDQWVDKIIQNDFLSSLDLTEDTTLLNFLTTDNQVKLRRYLSQNQECVNLIRCKTNEIFALDQWIRQNDQSLDGGLYRAIDSGFLFLRLDHLLNDILHENVLLSASTREVLVIMLRHQTGYPNQFEHFLPRINELKDREIISRHQYSQIIDAYMIRKTGFQLFGTHYMYDDATELVYFKPIENPALMNDRRIQLGLLPYFHTIEPLDESARGHRFSRPTKASEIERYTDFIATKCN